MQLEQIIDCPNCHKETEIDANFCGYCGTKLKLGDFNISTNSKNAPYAIYYPLVRQHWASYSIIFGIIGIGASLIIPLFGLILGIIGLFIALSSHRYNNLIRFKVAGIILSCLALILAVTLIIYNSSYNSLQVNQSKAASVVLNTPCFDIKFSTIYKISNSPKSCNVVAYYGQSYSKAEDLYRVDALKIINANSSNFINLVKVNLINPDLLKLSNNYNVIVNKKAQFLNNEAYNLSVYNPKTNVSITIEPILYNAKGISDNIFVIYHSTIGKASNLNALSKAWAWQ